MTISALLLSCLADSGLANWVSILKPGQNPINSGIFGERFGTGRFFARFKPHVEI
jgi:hypothetical protein